MNIGISKQIGIFVVMGLALAIDEQA
jgi:hypothetical protein